MWNDEDSAKGQRKTIQIWQISTSDPISLIVHKNDQFWFIATNMEYEILNLDPKMTRVSFNELKMNFLNALPNRLNWALLGWKWTSNIFFIILTPLSLYCSQTINFDVPHYRLFFEIFKWAAKSAQFSSINEP